MLASERIEEVLRVVGCGRRSLPLFLVLGLANMVQIQFITVSLINITLPFRCHTSASLQLEDVVYPVPDSVSSDIEEDAFFSSSGGIKKMAPQDFFDSKCLEPSTPNNVLFRPQNSSASSSQVPPGLHATGMASCPYIQYDDSQYISTIVSKFHLVCERATLRPLFQMMAMLGTIFSGIMAIPLGDWFGRLMVTRVTAMIAIPLHVMCAFVPWYPVLLVLQILLAVCNRSILLSTLSLVMESIPARNRTAVGIYMGIPYTLMVVGLAVAGYFLTEWRFIFLTGGLATYFMFPLSFIVEESPRWLAQNGKGLKAADQLMKAAYQNRIDLPPHLITSLDKLQITELEKEEKSSNSRTQKIQQYPIVMVALTGVSVLWLFNCLMYFCVILNCSHFSRADLYVGLVGVTETMAMLLMMPVTQRIGRRLVLGCGPFICGVLFMANLFLPEDRMWLQWLLAMTTVFIMRACYQTMYLYVNEIFPTTIRSRGIGFANSVGTVGSTLAPLVIDPLVQTVWWGAAMVMMISAVSMAVIICFLPETNNVALPDTLQDLKELMNKKKKQTRLITTSNQV
ncbi:solute carrier family 22 member 20-like isoform X2 [Scylla paramamosain]|uniref:solute carrier family 22 member 20-like isoform X2 n=1 Tax=Scylla paramamosain TaxID=85552 RepID=UPI003083AD10